MSLVVGDKVITNLAGCIFPYDKTSSLMASRGISGIVIDLPNNNTTSFRIEFVIDGVKFWSRFSEHELTKIESEEG